MPSVAKCKAYKSYRIIPQKTNENTSEKKIMITSTSNEKILQKSLKEWVYEAKKRNERKNIYAKKQWWSETEC